MLGRRWTRADGKRPITTAGKPASSTNSSTWATLRDARSSRAGDGRGVMLGGGLGCYDLDHCDVEDAVVFAATVPERIVFAERSVSGQGVHLFFEAPTPTESATVAGGPHPHAGRRYTTPTGLQVERYTSGRFIRVTGDCLTIPN